MASARAVATGLGAVVAAGAALSYAVLRLQAPSDGPAPVAWDREACAHCHMHVGEPAFAAQLQTEEGLFLHFDDPGCLFERLAAGGDRVRALWFHHVREDRWISGDEVAFLPVSPTPMGYGLGAVEAGTPGALTLAGASARIAAAAGARR